MSRHRRLIAGILIVGAWVGFGFGVNHWLSSRRTDIAGSAPVVAPSAVQAALALPGTLYVAQKGDIYRLQGTTFTDLHLPQSTGMWLQPAVVPGSGHILAVARSEEFSDLYVIDGSSGSVVQQLTHNQTKTSQVQANHWVFSPVVGSDGNTVFVSYDAPKVPGNYEVDLAIWSGRLDGKIYAQQWTDPNGFTGGDVEPALLPDGRLLFADYAIGADGSVFSRLAVISKAMNKPVYLTTDKQNCYAPAVSPDGNHVAMICANGNQATDLVVAQLSGTTLSAPVTVASNCLCAVPAWAPDGSGLAYYAPSDASGHFQLWWVGGAGTGRAQSAQQVTENLDLDATSPPAWAPATGQ